MSNRLTNPPAPSVPSLTPVSSAALPHVVSPQSRLLALHRFLAAHAFYPLLFCTLLCFGFVGTRAYIVRTHAYLFLVKNLFLAWIPYFISLAAVRLHESGIGAHGRRRWLTAGVWAAWLAMFPNAPYIFTDLVHWRGPHAMPWWFDLGLVLMFAFAGCFAGIVSLRIMHELVRRALGGRVGAIIGWCFVTAVALLSGLGIYLGRFERWNSWDLLTRPHEVVGRMIWNLTSPYAHARTLGVTLMFGALVLATYVMFVSTVRDTGTATAAPPQQA
jgi:uncharacterized membrane protein